MALSVKAEVQITGLNGGDIGVDGVPWQYASVADLKTLLYEELRLPAEARKDDLLSLLAGNAGQLLHDGDKLSDPHVRGKKLIVRGAELPPTLVRRQWFRPGVEVLLHSLQGAPELNGKRAVISGWDALKCRYDVIMDSTKLPKSVKPDNMQWAWVSPLAVGAAGGDARQAHVPLHGAFQPTQVPLPGAQGPGPSYAAPAYGGALGGANARGADAGGGGYGAALGNDAYHAASVGLGAGSPSKPPAAIPAAAASASALPSQRSTVGVSTGAVGQAMASPSPPDAEGPQEVGDLGDLLKELEGLKLDKERAIQEEDFDRAAALKRRHRELVAGLKDLPGKLKAVHEELESTIADKRKAVEAEDFKLAKQLKGRQSELEAQVKTLEDALANAR